MKFESSVTAVSWIPFEAVKGFLAVPFGMGLAHYDEPLPARLDDLDRASLQRDEARAQDLVARHHLGQRLCDRRGHEIAVDLQHSLRARGRSIRFGRPQAALLGGELEALWGVIRHSTVHNARYPPDTFIPSDRPRERGALAGAGIVPAIARSAAGAAANRASGGALRRPIAVDCEREDRRVGALDDVRLAEARATALAERGFGDAAIAFKLEQDGIEPEASAAALTALKPERERAASLAARRGASARTARWLAARGFAPESVEAALPTEDLAT